MNNTISPLAIAYRAILAMFLLSVTACSGSMQTSHETTSTKTPEIMKKWTRNLLVGRWRSIRTEKDGGKTEETDTIYADGTYRFKYKNTSKDGKITEFTTYGDWGLVKNIHFTIQRGQVVDGKDIKSPKGAVFNYMVYKVLRLNKLEFIYQDIDEGIVYAAKRLPSLEEHFVKLSQ